MRSQLFAARSLKEPKFRNHAPIVIKPGFCIGVALFLFLLPIKWVFSWFFAAIVHELFHYLAIKILRVRILSISIDFKGTFIETEPMRPVYEFICALSGPAGGLLILCFAKHLPLAAVCACLQSLYNFIPVFPLDGGRAIRCVILKLLPAPLGDKVYRTIESIALLLLAILCIYLAYRMELGLFPILLPFILLYKNGRIKIPCKQGK